MVKVDELTFIHSKGTFFLICVEINLQQKLIPSFSTLGKDSRLEYKGLHQICFKCGCYGHKVKNCDELIRDMLTRMVETTTEGDRKD
ncbi:hypothetical protein AHAS_Ahas03G0086500 [Arachis hypogaea]